MDVGEIPFQFDVLVYRRDMVGIGLMTMYLRDDEPAVTLSEVARKFDVRLIEVLENTGQ